MPINDAKWNLPAKRGDFTGTVITASVALDRIADAFEAQMKGDTARLKKEIAEIRKLSKSLDETFDKLTGWTND